ncbi:MAG: hypothetical protein ACOH15_03970 [Acetobacterium sp.]
MAQTCLALIMAATSSGVVKLPGIRMFGIAARTKGILTAIPSSCLAHSRQV